TNWRRTVATLTLSFHCSRAHPDLHSFPTRRSSDLATRRGADFAAENTGFISSPKWYTYCVIESRYASRSAIGRVATPESIAAFATAGATRAIRRGSKGRGMMYSGPKLIDSMP